MLGVLGQVQRGLARRVAPADNEHRAVHHRGRLGHRRAVEHPSADEPFEHRDAEAAVVDAGGHDRRARPHALAVGQRQHVLAALGSQADDVAEEEELGAEGPRLLEGAEREVGAADAAGETRVVPDEGAGPGLPADRPALDHQGREALGRGVDRARQPRRPGADDDHVVDGVGPDRAHQTERVGQLDVGRVHQRRRGRGELQDDHGQFRLLESQIVEDAARGLGVLGVEADRDVVAGEGVAQHVGPFVLPADQAHRLEAVALGEVPVVEDVGDRAVELLVPWPFRADELELGVPFGDGPEDGGGALEVTPPDDDRPLGRRLDRAGPPQEQQPLPVARPVVREHHGDLAAPAAQPLEDGPGVVVGPARDDLVVGAVPPAQLAVEDRPRFVVHRHQQHHRRPPVGHRPTASLATVLVATICCGARPGARMLRPSIRTAPACPPLCPAARGATALLRLGKRTSLLGG